MHIYRRVTTLYESDFKKFKRFCSRCLYILQTVKRIDSWALTVGVPFPPLSFNAVFCSVVLHLNTCLFTSWAALLVLNLLSSRLEVDVLLFMQAYWFLHIVDNLLALPLKCCVSSGVPFPRWAFAFSCLQLATT
jgi:hypothetical protein